MKPLIDLVNHKFTLVTADNLPAEVVKLCFISTTMFAVQYTNNNKDQFSGRI